MGLQINLKRGERLLIAGGSIRNDDQNLRLYLEGDLPVLRERELIKAEQANTPAKRLWLILQQIYLSRKGVELHELYILFARDVLQMNPAASHSIAAIDALVAAGDYFKALKEVRHLIDAEAPESEPAASPPKRRVLPKTPVEA